MKSLSMLTGKHALRTLASSPERGAALPSFLQGPVPTQQLPEATLSWWPPRWSKAARTFGARVLL